MVNCIKVTFRKYAEPVVKALDPRSRGLGYDSRALVTGKGKSLGQALKPHRLCPRSINGYQVERNIDTVRMASAAENTLLSPRGYETVIE